MSVITDIKQQVKRADRYSIFVDNVYTFSLSGNGLLNSGIHVGMELDSQKLKQLKGSAQLDKAYEQTLNLISIRKRSEWEIREYLKRKDYDPSLINTILNKLSISGYVNDEAFARAWVENRRLLKAISQRRLSQELRAKRISDEIIKTVLEEDNTDELQVLKDLIVKKRQQTRYKDNLKLMQYLVRQGYSYGDVKTAISEDSN